MDCLCQQYPDWEPVRHERIPLAEPPLDPERSASLYVGNLPFASSEAEVEHLVTQLQALFEPTLAVSRDAMAVYAKRGYARVHLKTVEEADKVDQG
jgi:hypothetical protein